MNIQTEHLGKVSITVEKDYHNINKCYDKLVIVEEENEFRTYISRKPVPSGVELTDRNYWIPFSSLERQIVIDYNKFKNDVLFASAFHEKLDPTLPEGVAIIKQLFDKDNNPIIPKVSEDAVSDETGKTLKAKLAELTNTLSNTIVNYLNTYFADTIEKAEDIVNHPTYIGEDNYVYVWNRITKTYDKTSIYTRGEGFHISKTFASIADMEAYTGTDLKEGDFVLIQSTPDDPDNAKLYTYSGTQGVYNYLVDMSGALGFTGKTPQFSIGSVITVNPDVPASASLSPDGTDADGNPKYKLNLALPKGRDAEEIFVKGEGTNSVKHKNSNNNYASGENSFTLGNYNNASGDNSFVLGEWNRAGRDSFVHGKMNIAGADKSHAEGNGTRCEGSVSHAEGSVTISNGSVSHSEGYGTVAHDMSHTEGVGAIVFRIKTLGNPNPIYKVISGVDTLSNVFKGFFIVTVVSNDDYHICRTSYATITNIEVREEDEEEGITAEDAGIYITTNDNLVVDPSNDTKAYILVNAGFTPGSHIEGYYNLSATFNGSKSFINTYIHNLFDNNLINKIYGGHVEGIGNIIGGKYSHAEGALNSTNNAIVHLEGKGNIANTDCQHVEGKFNEPDDTAAHIIGNGTDDAHRSNAAAFDWNGNLKIKGNLKDPQGNIIDATKFVIVNDHSGAGDDPNKIYIPSAESEKETYDSIMVIPASENNTSAKLKGTTNVVRGAKAVAFGDYNTIGSSASESFVVGRMNLVGAPKGAAFGNVNSVNANNGFASGGFNKVSRGSSYAEGVGNYVNGYTAHMEGNSTLQITLTGAANATTYTIAETLPSFFIGLPVYYAVSPENNDGVVIFRQGLITAIDAENNTITLDATLSTSTALENATARVLCATTQLKASHVEGSHNFIILNDALTENPLQDTIIQEVFVTEKEDRLQGGHVEGFGNVIAGKYSHAEGVFNIVMHQYSHAEGQENKVLNQRGHAEGAYNEVRGNAGHAEGFKTIVQAAQGHAEGYCTVADDRSHAEGIHTAALAHQANYSATNHAEGWGSVCTGQAGHAEGFGTHAYDIGSHSEGYGKLSVRLTGNEGDVTYSVNVAPDDDWLNSYVGLASTSRHYATKIIAIDKVNNTITLEKTLEVVPTASNNFFIVHNRAIGSASHTEGISNIAEANSSHAEGAYNRTTKLSAHAEGWANIAAGEASHAEGRNGRAYGDYSHTEGYANTAFGKAAHAGGDGSLIIELTGAAKATTYSTNITPHATWVGRYIKKVAEDYYNIRHILITEIDTTNNTITVNETLDGTNALSSTPYSVALGGAIADYSFAHGKGVQAGTEAGAVFGKFNVPRSNALFAIGNGTSYTNQHDAFYVDVDGNIYIAGNIVNAQMTQLTNKITELENRIAALEGNS